VPDQIPPYRLAVDRSPAPRLVYDTGSRRIVDANDAATTLYGYSREELLELRIDDLRPEEDVPLLHRRMAEIARTAVVDREGVRHRRADGSIFYVSFRSHPLDLGDRSLRLVFLREASDDAASAQALKRQAFLFESIKDAVVFTDADGLITDWNPAAERLWGYSREEVIGRDASFLHGETGDQVVQTLLDALEQDERWEGVLRTRSRDGAERVCDVRVLPLRDAAGRTVGTVGINRDITAQRRVERALAETAESFRILGDQIPHILWVADATGGSEYINDRWRELTGQPREASAGSGWIDAVHPDDRESTRDAWAHSLATASEFIQEHRLRTAEGDDRWHITRGTPVRDSRGRVVRWLGSSVDIHPQKTAEDQVRRREEYFRGVFENAHDAIVLADAETGRLIDANPQAEALYGCSREQLLELAVHELYGDTEDVDGIIAQVVDRGFGTFIVSQRTREGGAVQTEVNAAVMEHRDRSVLLTINRDLTERHELERQLQQAQKMEAVGRLAGGLAHDFNNLTTAIQGFAAILTEELGSDGEARDALEEIDRATARATDLTRQLLAYTRQQVMRGRVLDLNSVVESSRQLIARLIGEDVEVVPRLDPEIGAVRADPGQLNQVLMNLAVNARDAMGGGGQLVIETSNALLDREFADSHPPSEPGEYVRLRVSDTGHGMSEETRSRVFEPFYTTKPVGEGTGLGLATVYGIVKQSGGYIWVESEVGVGTTFDIYLPRVADTAEVPEEAAATEAAAPAVSRRGQTVLLVEDEAGVRKLAKRVLERAGFEVLVTENGLEALDLVHSKPQPIDLVVTDMVMPRMSGKELARQLALTHPGTRVLYMSGYTGESLAERGDLTRTDVVLEKPFRPAELVEAVRQRLRDEVE
jgi:two-component system cell cycle sensor histidine kinase/response regulator CckA